MHVISVWDYKLDFKKGGNEYETKYFQIRLAIILCTMTSCEDWLDVRPKSQVKEEDFFEKEDGFRNAMLGVYTIMASTELYGGETTMALLDVLAQQYSSVGSQYLPAIQYDYQDENSKSRIDGIWRNAYNGVVNCAPSYKSGKEKAVVPMVREVTNSPVAPSTVASALDILVDDLKEARDLVKDIDPLGPAHATYTESKSYAADDYLVDDGFWLYRTSRFNYYGMTALLARICLYKEDMSAALQYAQEVINSGKFALINDQTMSADSRNYPSVAECLAHHEYITSLYVYDLKKSHNDLYFLDTQASLNISTDRKTDLFGGVGLDFDFRARRFFSIPTGNTKEYINKYITGTQIPLLKLGEMYLIAAEASGDIEYLKTFRRLRGYVSNPLPDGEDLSTELTKEYQREFIAEGQLFYYYKRLNFSQIPNTSVPTTQDVYVFQQPDEEIEFGYTSN